MLDMTERLHFHFSLSCTGEGNGNPLQCFCLETPRDGGAWWAAVCGVAQSPTWLKRLLSSSRHNKARYFRGRSIRLPVSFTVHHEERHLCQEFHTLSVYHPSFTRREKRTDTAGIQRVFHPSVWSKENAGGRTLTKTQWWCPEILRLGGKEKEKHKR